MSDAKKKLGEYTPLLQPEADSAEPQPESSTSLSAGGLPSTGVNVGVFNDGPRPYQDRKWSWAFFGTLALVGVFGLVLGFTRDSDSFFLDASSPATCPVNLQHQSRSLLEFDDDVTAVPTMHPVWLVLGAFLCAFATGWLFVLGFKHRADLMVQVAIWSQISLFVLLGVGSLVSSPDSPMGGIILLALGGLWAYLLLKAWQPQIRLVTRLLALAGQAISENTGLVGLSVALQAGWGLLAIPTFTVLLFVALQNGYWSQNAAVFTLQRPAGTSASHAPVCMDQAGHTVDCCTWQVHGGAIAYMVLLGTAGCWAAMILDQVKHFTVAGTVAQWYFTPTLPGASCGSLPARSRVATSLRHALGPSFGSLCAAGALLAVVTFLKRMLAAQERRMARGGVAALFAMVLVWLLRLLLSFVEFMTKFTTVRMAVTGEAFFDAARNTYDLLKRNAMDALGMWWLPTLVLGNCALVASLAYGCLVAGLSQLLWGDAAPAGLWWALSWLVSFLAIMFFCQLLLISVDTLFLAAAMDRDAARVTRQEVHDLLKEVPGLQGALVEQPDGNLAYGSQPAHAAGVQRPASAVV